MAIAMDRQLVHAVQPDYNTDNFQPPQRAETLESTDLRGHGTAPRRRTSGNNVQGDGEQPRARTPSMRPSQSPAPRKRSVMSLRHAKAADEDLDDSAWIHRDKLAQIEIREMEDAGMHVRQPRRSGSAGPAGNGRSSRSASRNGLKRAPSRDQLQDGGASDESGGASRRKRVSTIPAADEDEYEQGFDPSMDAELRTPEEVAAEQQHQLQHVLRPSTSRIPISKLSTMPVPMAVVDRESPLTRSRNGSLAFGAQFDQYARGARRGSEGSHILLDDGEGIQSTSRPGSSRASPEYPILQSQSPLKARMPGRDTPVSGARKGTASALSTARPQSSAEHKRNQNSLSGRPTSRSGARSPRPTTSSQKPEGEAPWLATMYKPDPRLPPEEQMLPTHAKRLMQEQWEKDGKTGTAYDRDFRLLNTDALEPRGENISPTWPLGGRTSPAKSDAASLRPGTSGGYRITPTIASPPTINMQSANISNRQIDTVKHNATPRIPDFDIDEKEDGEANKEKKKKKETGCMGCVIM